MYITINMQDMTPYIAPDAEDNGSDQSGGIQYNASLSDPSSTWDFVLDDINQTLNLKTLMPIIVFDENAPALAGVPTVPSMNFALDALLTTPIGVGNLWSPGGTNGGLFSIAVGGRGYVMAFSNSPVASGYLEQTTVCFVTPDTINLVPGYIQPGTKYMFSVYVQGVSPVNIQYFLQINWLDVGSNLLSSITMTPTTPPTSEQHISISGVAPANAVYAQIQFGGQATNSTNSGTILFSSVQFEPMWFVWDGVQYPTPDCNESQVNTVAMPDGTYSRACRIFAGYVEDLVRSYVGKQRHYTVNCASSSKILETSGFVNLSFTDQTDDYILDLVIGNLPGDSPGPIGTFSTDQQNEFAPLRTIVTGSTIDSISFTNNTLREVLNSLVSFSGSQFYVDPYYYLWYVPPSFVSQVFELSDTPDNVMSFSYHDFSIEDDATSPVNSALIVGSKQNAAAFTQTFSGDGTTTVFFLSKPPDTITSVTKDSGTVVRCGVAGVNQIDSTYRALVNKQLASLTFAIAPVSGTNNVSITYTYEDQVQVQALSADAIAEANGVQFWGLVNDTSITSTIAAKNRGLTELQDYAFPRQILTLSALNIFMPAGSLILFTCQSEGMVNEPFTVQTVASDPQGGGVYSWNYTAGAYNPTVIDHLRNAVKAVARNPTTANVSVISSIDVAILDTTFLNDTVTTNYNGAPNQGPYKYGSCQYGFAVYS